MAEILHLADFSDRRKNQTIEYDKVADVIQLPRLELPTQRQEDIERQRQFGRRALLEPVITDTELPIDGFVERAVSKFTLPIGFYADGLRRDSEQMGADEAAAVRAEAQQLEAEISWIRLCAKEMATEGNSLAEIRDAITQGLMLDEKLYQIACGRLRYGAQ